MEEHSTPHNGKQERDVLNHRMEREDPKVPDLQTVEAPQILKVKFLYTKS